MCSTKHSSNLVRNLGNESTNVAVTVVAALSHLPVNAHINLYSGHDQFLQLSRSTIHRCVLFITKVQNEIQAVQPVTADRNSAGLGPWVLGTGCNN